MQLNLFKENKNKIVRQAHQPIVIPDFIKKCAVTDCKTALKFIFKYRKAERFTQRGKDYVNAIMKTHNQELKDQGYTTISNYDSVTGKFISFIS